MKKIDKFEKEILFGDHHITEIHFVDWSGLRIHPRLLGSIECFDGTADLQS